MPDTNPQAEPLRIPIGRNVTYAVRGMPPVANAYGPGFLVPTEVSLTYRAAEDSQLGRFHAYVKGQWLRDGEVVPTGEKLPGQHYNGDPATWPAWLAEEARLHDPDAPPAVPVSAAEEATQAATHYAAHARAERARLEATLLRRAADVIDETRAPFPIAVQNGITWATAELRRMAAAELRRLADEAHPAEEATACSDRPCNADADELCDNHARIRYHAMGEHAFCGPECEPETQGDDDVFELPGPEVVAYRNPDRPSVLLCREHGDGWWGLTPLTSDDLPDGGTCTYGDPADPNDVCGTDVLIPQQPTA